ncbi:MAG: CoA transferase, partial [Burkholderiales bacterium]
QAGNDHPTGIPTGVFPTSDGHINIAAASERVWERLCDAIGHPEWKQQPEYRTRKLRSEHRTTLNATISEITRHKPSAHWVELFEESGVPCGPIYSIDQVFADPQVQHLGMAAPVKSRRKGDFQLVASPINMEGVQKKIRSATPEAGQHTEEILKTIGYGDPEIEAMKSKGVI